MAYSQERIIKQYHATYDSKHEYFVVHRQASGKPNMLFKMHETGLHYFDPNNESFMFASTVAEKKQNFTKHQAIQRAGVAKALYAKLSYYPLINDFKWVIRSNQVKDCPITVQDIEVASKIWAKDIAALKGKTDHSDQ